MKSRLRKILPLVVPIGSVILLVAVSVVFASSGGEGGHGGGEEGSSLGTMIWRIVNFVILMALLWKLLADKIKKYFVDRRDEIAQMIEEADKAKSDAQAQYADIQGKLKNVEKDIQDIKVAIMGELGSEKDRIIEEGKVAAERIIQQAKWTAEQEVVKAKNELKDHVVEMAGDMASGMINRSMTPDDQKRILEEYLDKVVR
ncbi:MAG TPA: ATP synthase F0 subunit B [Deltaproteobacteria bacterium]|jgi:F-type H+-transporting ATPase subunit b|nr:ATP synthase F0 subunit B [Deltaproteobacteria bacterium]OQC20066.1 MAG: ATP synthase subunit b, sodium ion specific [Deltaproteobacteria bacterium ADurb.Bin072]HRW81170.1 ATP synthase F0 subunit B [Desulfomonilia bacterium]HNQ85891.1 ATP synthase F0 subunit B [Deltaproteobacteria bacterium]HNS90080.1 ATP synthase F0 subunit B [Deltaproteobacteria bacterium]